MKDKRVEWVAVGCGNCIECRTQEANAWRTRLLEEYKADNNAYFVTLTFTDENLEKLCGELQTEECNAVAGLAIRRFLERWRKTNKKSVKHWLITELGHEGTERIHIHGIIWTDKENAREEIKQKWAYGQVVIGETCNAKTINYIVKYITKIDKKHKNFRGQKFCSAGLGKTYIESYNAQQNKYRGPNTKETYQLQNGTQIGLPIYYRNKIYSEEEKEQLWLHRLDKKERYVMGIKVKVNNIEGEREYYSILAEMQKINKRLGYGDDSKMWRREDYNVTLKKLKGKSV